MHAGAAQRLQHIALLRCMFICTAHTMRTRSCGWQLLRSMSHCVRRCAVIVHSIVAARASASRAPSTVLQRAACEVLCLQDKLSVAVSMLYSVGWRRLAVAVNYSMVDLAWGT